MARLNLEKFKANADKIIQEKSTQGLFSDSQKKLITLELELLKENSFRLRLNNSNIEELGESIESFGQLEPIIITKNKNGYEILNGHSRVEAMKIIGCESALCMLINIVDNNSKYYPYILNKNSNIDDFEISYYLERLVKSDIEEKVIQKKLGINLDKYKRYNFEYNLFDVLQNSKIMTYKYLKEISKIKNEALRDETLDHIVQKLINTTEIENYLLKVKEEDIGAKYTLKKDGVKIKKNSYKMSMDIDERQMSFNEINEIYNFIDEMVKN